MPKALTKALRKALPELDADTEGQRADRYRPSVRAQCPQMPGNAPNRPHKASQCPRPALPIAAGTVPALRRPGEYEQLLMQRTVQIDST